MANFDVSTPAGSDLLSQGDDKIREFKNAMLDALRCGEAEGVESIFPGSSPSTDPVFHYRGLKGSTIERPTAGQSGLYFDTTRMATQRDNGTSWDDIGTVIPSGTKMVFYQASAPTGWTAVAVNDKFLRVVTSGGTGGSTGGTMAASTDLAHTHTTGNFTLTSAEIPSHTHRLLAGQNAISGWGAEEYGDGASIGVSGARAGTGGSAYYASTPGGSGSASIEATGSGGAHNHGTSGSTAIGVFAYADIIIASKD